MTATTEVAVQDLGAIGAQALGDDDVDQPDQGTLVDAHPGPAVKFQGIKASVSEDHGLRLGQRVTFSGAGRIIGLATELRGQDDTEREVITIKVDDTSVAAS